jgi:hypothetical protein
MPPVILDEMKRRSHIHRNLLCKIDIMNLLDTNVLLSSGEIFTDVSEEIRASLMTEAEGSSETLTNLMFF